MEFEHLIKARKRIRGDPDQSLVAHSVKSVRDDNRSFVRYGGFDEPVPEARPEVLFSADPATSSRA